jgi:hypothetical protein
MSGTRRWRLHTPELFIVETPAYYRQEQEIMPSSVVDSKAVTKHEFQHLEDRWDENTVRGMDQPELLRYRSNLLGSDLRITNFGGGNTSSKVEMPDPLTRKNVQVLWVKGSGGDLGSMPRAGFATLYMDKLLALEELYGGVEREDEMAAYYPLCTYGLNPVAASIDTPLHGFLPFPHVCHRSRSGGERSGKDGGVQSAVQPQIGVGAVAAAGF